MATLITSVTSKGQVTIPAEVRERLGIRPRDRVRFVVDEDGEVRIVRELSLRDVYRSVPALKQPRTREEIDRIITDERAIEFARRHIVKK